jgi:L-fuculose-phosphate aldolase
MSSNLDGTLAKLISFGKEAATKKLIWANSGNISHRLDDNTFFISVSGAHLEMLDEEDFVLLDHQGNVLEGIYNPSIESGMHLAIYKVNPETKAIFHSQAFFTTLLSCTDMEVNPHLFPESMAYLKSICRVSYNHPGSQELANHVEKTILHCNIMILNNHGAICAGPSLSDVLLKTETLEMLCKMIVLSRVSEINLNFLPSDLKDDFLDHLKQIKKSM